MSTSLPSKLTAKQGRILDRCLRELFSAKAFGSVADLLELEPIDAITRLVSVSEKGGFKIPLSTRGKMAHDRIVATLHEAGVWE